MSGENGQMRVLVVDDSPFNRHVISDVLSARPEIRVVGHASNGEQALRMVAELEPDAITLDVEMPKMDGFTFLRILASTRPTPVLVVSSHSASDTVFRALELGAYDFVAKPEDLLRGRDRWADELCAKLLASSQARRARRVDPAPSSFPADRKPGNVAPRFVVAIASSTGGPSALLHVLSRLPPSFPGSILIALHMAPQFTKSFAERLHRTTPMFVCEAVDGEPIYAGHAYVCPGGSCMVMRRDSNGSRIQLVPPGAEDRYVPSGNRLLASVGEAMGSRAIGVVLTGMADDGLEGARALRNAGGLVIAESEETTVVNGMPGAVVRAGLAHKVLPLPAIPDELIVGRRSFDSIV